MGTILVKYPSTCCKCGNQVSEGQRARWDRTQPKGKRLTCLSCFTGEEEVKPVTAEIDGIDGDASGPAAEDFRKVKVENATVPQLRKEIRKIKALADPRPNDQLAPAEQEIKRLSGSDISNLTRPTLEDYFDRLCIAVIEISSDELVPSQGGSPSAGESKPADGQEGQTQEGQGQGGEGEGQEGQTQEGQGEGQEGQEDHMDELAKIIAKKVEKYLDITPEVDEETIRKIAQEEAIEAALNVKPADRPVQVTVTNPDGTANTVDVGIQHKMFPLLLAVMSARLPNGDRLHSYLAGPAGSGKTSACVKCAEALGLDYDSKSFGKQSQESHLMGYMWGGEYIPVAYRNRFQDGGLMILDEIDNASASVPTVVNSSLANGYCNFPDRKVERHPDFVVVANANTFGRGADNLYVGRQQQDAAFLDRFCFIEWEYDESFEAALIGIDARQEPVDISKGGLITKDEWFDKVKAFRKAVTDHKLRMVISPRATMMGAALIEQGVGLHWLLEMLIFKGADELTREKLTKGEGR